MGAIGACLAGGTLAAERIELVEGNPNSRVRATIFSDLQCSDCLRFRQMLDEKIMPRYGQRVAFVHRDFPLPKHEWARAAALAGRWIAEKDRILAFRFQREIMSEQLHLRSDLLEHWLRQFALRTKLNPDEIVAAIMDPRLIALLEQDRQAAMSRKVKKTPTVFVANQAFEETIIYDELAKALDVELGH